MTGRRGRSGAVERCWGRAAVAVLLMGVAACNRKTSEEDWRGPPPQESEKPRAQSPDRLPPDQLMEGEQSVYGFTIPRQMTLSRPSSRTARVAGQVDFDQLTDYVRARINARHAELLANELIFPKVTIRGADPERTYEVRLKNYPHERIVHFRDLTPLPKTPGLTDEQRWNRAGFKPGGGLVDPRSME